MVSLTTLKSIGHRKFTPSETLSFFCIWLMIIIFSFPSFETLMTLSYFLIDRYLFMSSMPFSGCKSNYLKDAPTNTSFLTLSFFGFDWRLIIFLFSSSATLTVLSYFLIDCYLLMTSMLFSGCKYNCCCRKAFAHVHLLPVPVVFLYVTHDNHILVSIVCHAHDSVIFRDRSVLVHALDALLSL